MEILLFITAPFILIGIVWAAIYNGLVQKRNACRNTFSGIEVQLKKRHNLIPNLVSVVKGYAAHEQALFEHISTARTLAMQASTSTEQLQHEATISYDLPQIIGLAENYPNLKADSQFLNLQRNLTEIESQISAARRAYNASVKQYNDSVESFPSNIVASKHNFQQRDFFSIDISQLSAPSI